MCKYVCSHYRVSDEVYPYCFPRTSQLEVPCGQVRASLCDLASARHKWLSCKMLAAISILLSHTSNLMVSLPSNVGMSRSKDVVRFICHCVMHKVSVYCCIAVCKGSSTCQQGECGCNVTASCFSLLGRCFISLTCTGGLVVSPN